MLTAFFRIRWMSVLAVVASLFGALLLFVLGSLATIDAFSVVLGLKEAHLVAGPALEATVELLEALDPSQPTARRATGPSFIMK